MYSHKKTSFAVIFLGFYVLIILFVTASLGGIFVFNFRSMAFRSVLEWNKNQINITRDRVISPFQQWESLLYHRAFAAAPFLAQDPIEPEDVFPRMQQSQEGVSQLYATSTQRWTEPGGFVSSSLRTPADPHWDTTTRSWYIGAKAKSEKIAYAEPYIAANTGDLPTVITDIQGRELGIIAGNVSIAFLTDLIQIRPGSLPGSYPELKNHCQCLPRQSPGPGFPYLSTLPGTRSIWRFPNTA